MNIFKAMAVADLDEATRSIPVIDYFKTLEGVGERMLPVLARALDMPADFFAPFFAAEARVNLRFLHYPPQEMESNDRFLSTPHGVLNESGTDRYSIAFFYSPSPDAVIECLPSCVGPDNPPRYPQAVYRDLVLAFYNANYVHRQGYTGARPTPA